MENYKIYKLKEFDVFVDYELKAIYVDFKKSPSCLTVKLYEGKRDRFIKELATFLTNELKIKINNFNLIQFTFIGTTIIFHGSGKFYIIDSTNTIIHNNTMYSFIQELMNFIEKGSDSSYGC